MFFSKSVSFALCAVVKLSLTQVAVANYSANSYKTLSSCEIGKEELLSNMAEQFLKYMDKTVDPCDNFYKYTCGNFQQFHPVSGPKPRFSIDSQWECQFERIASEFFKQPLRDYGYPQDAATKARLFYKTCLDTDTIRQQGVESFKNYVRAFGGWEVLTGNWNEESFDVIEILAKLSHLRSHTILGVTIGSKRVGGDIVVISAGDSFLSGDNFRNTSKVASLREFFEKVLIVSGVLANVARKTSQHVSNFEVEIAKLQFDQISPERAQNLTLGELEAQVPLFEWSRLLKEVFGQRLGSQQRILLKDKIYFSRLPILLQNTPKKILADYIFLKTLLHLSPPLLTGLENIENSFKKFVTPEEVGKSCQKGTIAIFSDVLAAEFAKTYFKNENKEEVVSLGESIKRALAKSIDQNSWLEDETKLLIRRLLDEMELKVEHFGERFSESSMEKKYKDLQIIPNKFFESVLSTLQKVVFDELKSLNKPPKIGDWQIFSTEIRAHYDRIENKVVVGAGMLQPPYYHTHFPRAINFGAIGSLIGHEIAHALDINGIWTQLDVTAHSRWTTSSMRKSGELADCFVDQFNNYTINNVSVNGTATLEENIADTTGIRLAFRAYLEQIAQSSSEDNLILPRLNMTDKQLFFLSFAHSWCSASFESSTKSNIIDDFHSPSEFRVIGALSNSEEFAEAFNCPVGSNMNPTNKCIIW